MTFFKDITKAPTVGKSLRVFEVPSDLIDALHFERRVLIPEEMPKVFPNQPLVLKSTQQSALCLVAENGNQLVKVQGDIEHYGIRGRNKEQILLQNILDNPKIRCIVITGRAGTGKSTIISAYTLHAILSQKTLKKAIFAKPLEVVGTSRFVGTLPGTAEEKAAPFMASFLGCFEGMDGGMKGLDYLQTKDRIQFMPLEYMRGMSIRDSVAWFDEAQNLDFHSCETLGSRIDDRGESKLILSGDLNQIDNRKITKEQSGMLKMLKSQAFLESPYTATIDLVKNERGEISELFYKIFNEEGGGVKK